GKSYHDAHLLVHSFIVTLLREHPRQRVLLITHQVVVLSFRKLLERMEEETVLALDRQDEARPASLLIYEFGRRDGRNGALVPAHWNLILFDRDPPAAKPARAPTPAGWPPPCTPDSRSCANRCRSTCAFCRDRRRHHPRRISRRRTCCSSCKTPSGAERIRVRSCSGLSAPPTSCTPRR